MAVDSFAIERLNAMLTKADALLKTYKAPPAGFIGFEGWVDSSLFAEWRNQSLVLLRQTLGSDHTYSAEFADQTSKESVPSSVRKGTGLLTAARDDIEAGYLRNTRELLAGEIFANLLDQAEHLRTAGYHHAAASLAGAVLEDGLRRAATVAGLAPRRRDGLESLTTSLAQAGRITALAARKIDTWRTIRNSADHGRFEEFTSDDVRTMIEGVTESLDRLASG